MAAAAVATASSAASNGCAAAAMNAATPCNGASTIARKSTGCSNTTIGPAARFESGATRLMRPNVHAMSGAVTTVASIDTARSRTNARRHPRTVCDSRRFTQIPAATSAAKPTTLNCQPSWVTTRGSTSGIAAPRASTAHGDTGRPSARLAVATPSIAALRSAGGGAPIAAT